MPMRMAVPCSQRYRLGVLMPMVFVMRVLMIVLKQAMIMFMRMLFGKVQVYAKCHQATGQQQWCGYWFAEQRGQQCPKEWRH